MPAINPQLDKHGFPIPATFDDLRPRTPRRKIPRRAALTIVLVVAVVLGILGSRQYWGRQFGEAVAALYERRGLEQQMLDDLPAAQAHFERAVWWAPERLSGHFYRGMVRLEQGDLSGSIEDFDHVILRNPIAEAYGRRSQALQRLGRHEQAIADATRVIELSPGGDPNPWNTRAYVRALAGQQLEAALEDVEKAIDLAGDPNAAYLDTRGYLLYLLGSYESALADLEQAVTLAEDEKQWSIERVRQGNRLAEGAVRRWERSQNETLAVLYHHRGLARQKLGKDDAAQVDLRRAEKLGYNPAQGVM